MRKSLHFKQRLILPGEGVLFYSGLTGKMIQKVFNCIRKGIEI
jgi:hypothetical protein